MPTDLLDRVRWLFFLFLLFGVASSIPSLSSHEIEIWPNQVVAALSGAALITWALWTWRTGGRWWWADLVPAVAMATAGIMLDNASWVAGQAGVTLFFRSLYGSRTRVLLNAVLYYAAHESVAGVVDGTRQFGPELASFPLLVSFLFTAALVSELARLVGEYQRGAAREVALTEASALLLAARSSGEIHAVTVDAMRHIAGVDGDQGVAIVLREDDGVLQAVAASPVSLGDVRLPLASLPASIREPLVSGTAVRVDREQVEGVARMARLPGGLRDIVLAPTMEDDELRGALAVGSVERLASGVEQPISRLGVDLTLALRRTELTEEIEEREALFRGVIESSSDVIAIVDTRAEIRFVSPSVEQVFGYQQHDLVGRDARALLHPEDHDRFLGALSAASTSRVTHRDPFDCRFHHTDGDWLDCEVTANRIADGSAGLVLNIRNVSERKKLEEEITYRAYHDPVTRLANRALFSDRLAAACERLRRSDSQIAVVLLDLDDFKAVNDNLGHAAGDALLVEVGDRLGSRIRATDTAARLGGDEFAVLFEDVGDAGKAIEIVERMLKALRRPVNLADRVVSIHASVGLVVSGDPNADPEELLRNADVAMYAAKASGKGRYAIFEPSMHVAALERLELRAELEESLERHQLQLHYQPVVALDTGRVMGFEALLRWNHPVRGMVPPNAFIPLAEESRLILPIGRWVVEEACRQLARWQVDRPTDTPLHVAVNLSSVQLLDPEIVDTISDALRAARLAPELLTLEVTETALMLDVTASTAALDELKQLGVRIAIDDFGTGYSSFGYLRRFPVDVLKVDQSFISTIQSGPEESALAHAIVKLAQTLGMETVAEGVEQQSQISILQRWQCNLGQGYLFSPPLPADVVPRWLTNYEAAPAERATFLLSDS